MNRSATGADSAMGSSAGQNKFLAAQMLRQAGLPVPQHHLVSTVEQAVTAAQQLGFPVVVKPADRDRGEGVSIDLNCDEAVREAFEKARKLSRNVLVEKTIPGICCRIVVVGDSAVYAVKRLPKTAEGDGEHSVRELIAIGNEIRRFKARHLQRKVYPIDALAIQSMEAAGFTLDAIPEKGALIPLRPIEATEWGGTPDVITDLIHPENLRIAVRAAQMMGLTVCGVDLITDDPSLPWYENSAAINEVNYAPFLTDRFDYQKQGLNALLERLLPDGWRIPIEVYIGDAEALTAAQKRQAEYGARQTRCVLVSHDAVNDGKSHLNMPFISNDLFSRCVAVLLDRTVEAVILVLQTDELVYKGLPVDCIDKIIVVNNHVMSYSDQLQSASAEQIQALMNLLRQYTVDGS